MSKQHDRFRALLTADVHMSNSLPHSRPATDEGVTDRLLDQQKLWDEIHASAREHKVDATFVLGDLFDSSVVDPATLIATSAALKATPVQLYILPGNHEANGELFISGAFEHLGSNKITYLGGLEPEGYCSMPWLRFWPMDYSTPERLNHRIAKAKLKMVSDGRKPAEVALLHHSIVGCSHFGWTCDDGVLADDVCEPFDHVFTGHFHERQTFGPGDKGLYLGAPMHHRYDDVGRDAGWWIMEWTHRSGKVELSTEFIPSSAPRFHAVKWSGKSSLKGLKAKPGDYVRLVVEATHAEWTKLKPGVSTVVGHLRDRGVRASWKHKPLYHHGRRLKGRATKVGSLDFVDAIDAYLSAPDVDTSGLDIKKLRRLGRELLEAAGD